MRILDFSPGKSPGRKRRRRPAVGTSPESGNSKGSGTHSPTAARTPLGVTLNFTPATGQPLVNFRSSSSKKLLDTVLTQVGQGTPAASRSASNAGEASNVSRAELIRSTTGQADISYAIAFTGATFPPPGLAIPGPAPPRQPPPAATPSPELTALAAPPAPTGVE
jgi:hypothetical protein